MHPAVSFFPQRPSNQPEGVKTLSYDVWRSTSSLVPTKQRPEPPPSVSYHPTQHAQALVSYHDQKHSRLASDKLFRPSVCEGLKHLYLSDYGVKASLRSNTDHEGLARQKETDLELAPSKGTSRPTTVTDL